MPIKNALKKWMVFLILMSMPLISSANFKCSLFYIIVKNNTPVTCYLIKKNLRSGAIITNAPYKILPGMKNNPIALQATYNAGANLSLKYECNEGRTITINSTQSACTPGGGEVQGAVVSSQNMDADYHLSHANYWKAQSGYIYWTLYDKRIL